MLVISSDVMLVMSPFVFTVFYARFDTFGLSVTYSWSAAISDSSALTLVSVQYIRRDVSSEMYYVVTIQFLVIFCTEPLGEFCNVGNLCWN